MKCAAGLVRTLTITFVYAKFVQAKFVLVTITPLQKFISGAFYLMLSNFEDCCKEPFSKKFSWYICSSDNCLLFVT